MDMKKMIDFDVEKAKAGANVVTRNGLKVSITDYNNHDDYSYDGLFCIRGVAHGKNGEEYNERWTVKGRPLGCVEDCPDEYDLFIEPKEYTDFRCAINDIRKAIDRASNLIAMRQIELQRMKGNPVDDAMYQFISNEIDTIICSINDIDEMEEEL